MNLRAAAGVPANWEADLGGPGQLSDGVHKLGDRGALGDEAIRGERAGRRHLTVCAVDDDRHRRQARVSAHAPRDLPAIHAGHVEVEHDQVGWALAEPCECARAGIGEAHPVTDTGQNGRRHGRHAGTSSTTSTSAIARLVAR
jgi:hypothetical protein